MRKRRPPACVGAGAALRERLTLPREGGARRRCAAQTRVAREPVATRGARGATRLTHGAARGLAHARDAAQVRDAGHAGLAARLAAAAAEYPDDVGGRHHVGTRLASVAPLDHDVRTYLVTVDGRLHGIKATEVVGRDAVVGGAIGARRHVTGVRTRRVGAIR